MSFFKYLFMLIKEKDKSPDFSPLTRVILQNSITKSHILRLVQQYQAVQPLCVMELALLWVLFTIVVLWDLNTEFIFLLEFYIISSWNPVLDVHAQISQCIQQSSLNRLGWYWSSPAEFEKDKTTDDESCMVSWRKTPERSVWKLRFSSLNVLNFTFD